METKYDAKSLTYVYFYAVSRAEYGIPGVQGKGVQLKRHDGKYR